MREFITHYVLRPNGYDTLTAEDGASALGLARLLGPDLIITDLQMPEMSGIELVQKLVEEGRDIPAILISSDDPERRVTRQALRAGVADYITKPFEPEELLESVRRVLDRTRARRERARLQAELSALNTSLVQRLKELETLAGVGRNVTSVLDADQV